MSRKSDYKDGEYKIAPDYEKACLAMMGDMVMIHTTIEGIIDDIFDGKDMVAGVKLRELYMAIDDRLDAYKDEVKKND